MLGSAFGRQQAVGYREQRTEQWELLCHKSLSGHCRPQSIVSGVVRCSGDESTILQVDGNWLELAEGEQTKGILPWHGALDGDGRGCRHLDGADPIDGLQ